MEKQNKREQVIKVTDDQEIKQMFEEAFESESKKIKIKDKYHHKCYCGKLLLPGEKLCHCLPCYCGKPLLPGEKPCHSSKCYCGKPLLLGEKYCHGSPCYCGKIRLPGEKLCHIGNCLCEKPLLIGEKPCHTSKCFCGKLLLLGEKLCHTGKCYCEKLLLPGEKCYCIYTQMSEDKNTKIDNKRQVLVALEYPLDMAENIGTAIEMEDLKYCPHCSRKVSSFSKCTSKPHTETYHVDLL